MFKKIGSLFLIKPSALNIEEKSIYRDLNFKHFIFFKEHFKKNFKEYLKALKDGLDFGFLAIDQEGGRVCRIKGDFKSPLEIANLYLKEKNKKIVINWAGEIAKILKKFDINLNLAPCVDIADEKAENFLKGRTFGKDPDLIKELTRIFIEEHQKQGIFTCIKHFPGLKEVKIDPHIELPFKEKIDQQNLEIFMHFKDKVYFIMTTHIVIREIDKLPATFSQKIIEILRKTGYKKAILSDDLNMGALKKWELQERIILSLASGHNMLIYCGNWKDLIIALFDIKTEIEKSKVLREKLKESCYILNSINNKRGF